MDKSLFYRDKGGFPVQSREASDNLSKSEVPILMKGSAIEEWIEKELALIDKTIDGWKRSSLRMRKLPKAAWEMRKEDESQVKYLLQHPSLSLINESVSKKDFHCLDFTFFLSKAREFNYLAVRQEKVKHQIEEFIRWHPPQPCKEGNRLLASRP